MARRTEYCRERYNYNLEPDHQLITHTSHDEIEKSNAEILREEVIYAMRALKEGKSPGIDNIPAELLIHGGPVNEQMITKV
jgi:hypothetical protein